MDWVEIDGKNCRFEFLNYAKSKELPNSSQGQILNFDKSIGFGGESTLFQLCIVTPCNTCEGKGREPITNFGGGDCAVCDTEGEVISVYTGSKCDCYFGTIKKSVMGSGMGNSHNITVDCPKCNRTQLIDRTGQIVEAHKKVSESIDEWGFTYTVTEAMQGYLEHKKQYVSHTMKHMVQFLGEELELLTDNLRMCYDR